MKDIVVTLIHLKQNLGKLIKNIWNNKQLLLRDIIAMVEGKKDHDPNSLGEAIGNFTKDLMFTSSQIKK